MLAFPSLQTLIAHHWLQKEQLCQVHSNISWSVSRVQQQHAERLKEKEEMQREQSRECWNMNSERGFLCPGKVRMLKASTIVVVTRGLVTGSQRALVEIEVRSERAVYDTRPGEADRRGEGQSAKGRGTCVMGQGESGKGPRGGALPDQAVANRMGQFAATQSTENCLDKVAIPATTPYSPPMLCFATFITMPQL